MFLVRSTRKINDGSKAVRKPRWSLLGGIEWFTIGWVSEEEEGIRDHLEYIRGVGNSYEMKSIADEKGYSLLKELIRKEGRWVCTIYLDLTITAWNGNKNREDKLERIDNLNIARKEYGAENIWDGKSVIPFPSLEIMQKTLGLLLE